MTPAQWLTRAREHQDTLLYLISWYHPQVRSNIATIITAPAAEDACRRARAEIVKECEGKDPATVRFKAALASDDHAEVYTLLSETWLGVPESEACWSIRGFSECVDLLDEPPETEAEMESRL